MYVCLCVCGQCKKDIIAKFHFHAKHGWGFSFVQKSCAAISSVMWYKIYMFMYMRACGSSRENTCWIRQKSSIHYHFRIELWHKHKWLCTAVSVVYTMLVWIAIIPVKIDKMVWVPSPNAYINDTIVSVCACACVRVFKGDEAFHVWLPSFCQPATQCSIFLNLCVCVQNMLRFTLFSTNFTT